MPLNFNPSAYTNLFTGEIIESDVLKASNSNEYLRLVIAPMDHQGNKMIQATQCYMPNCAATVIHRHQPSLFEDEKQSSQLFKFLDSLNKKGKTDTTGDFNHKDLIGRVYQWEQKEIADGRKDDNGVRRTQTYFYIAGPDPRTEPEPETLDETHLAPTSNGVNGNMPTEGFKTKDPDLMMASYSDGKTFQQIVSNMSELMSMFDANFVVNEIMSRNVFTRLQEKQLISIEGDTYKTSEQVADLLYK